MEERVGWHAEELVVRVHEEIGERSPAAGVVKSFGFGGVGREGEEDAGLGIFGGEGVFERVKVFAGEEDGFKELVLFLGADELDVLLEAQFEFEVALWRRWALASMGPWSPEHRARRMITRSLTSFFRSSFLFSAHHSSASLTFCLSKLCRILFICSKVSISTSSTMPFSPARARALSP